MTNPDNDRPHHPIPITIDTGSFQLDDDDVTGQALRALPPVPADRDLWLEVPGPTDDVLIRPEVTYEVKPGSHFYTAPSTINPGGS